MEAEQEGGNHTMKLTDQNSPYKILKRIIIWNPNTSESMIV